MKLKKLINVLSRANELSEVDIVFIWCFEDSQSTEHEIEFDVQTYSLQRNREVNFWDLVYNSERKRIEVQIELK